MRTIGLVNPIARPLTLGIVAIMFLITLLFALAPSAAVPAPQAANEFRGNQLVRPQGYRAPLGPQEGLDLPPNDLERVKVGDQAPDFVLENLHGRRVSLSDFRGKKFVILVFYRGHWSNWCNEQLGNLQKFLERNQWEDLEIVAVSTDSHDESREMIQWVQATYGVELSFPMLADVDHTVISRYGLSGTTGPDTRKFATPATFVLDKEGVVRWRAVDDNWKIRPTNEVILAVLDKVRRGEDASEVTLESAAMVDPLPGERLRAPSRRGKLDKMVLIPAGPFKMGRSGQDSALHEANLDAFYIDKYEVTNRQYRLFLQDIANSGDHGSCYPLEAQNKTHRPKYWEDSRYNGDDFPVVGVDWFDAHAYCAWAGKQLPTEAQWEKAARGGLVGKEYPWGEGRNEKYANLTTDVGEAALARKDKGDNFQARRDRGPKPVGSYEPNGFGLFDAVGNAEEWVWDWYGENYYHQSIRKNPLGPDRGLLKAVRGGSWNRASGRVYTRYTHSPLSRTIFLGFRCGTPAQE